MRNIFTSTAEVIIQEIWNEYETDLTLWLFAENKKENPETQFPDFWNPQLLQGHKKLWEYIRCFEKNFFQESDAVNLTFSFQKGNVALPVMKWIFKQGLKRALYVFPNNRRPCNLETDAYLIYLKDENKQTNN